MAGGASSPTDIGLVGMTVVSPGDVTATELGRARRYLRAYN